MILFRHVHNPAFFSKVEAADVSGQLQERVAFSISPAE
jgi:hypothetical protein